jgi:hypothetical protein
MRNKKLESSMTFFASTAIDANIILDWLYCNNTLKNDMIEMKLKTLLVVFTAIGSFVWFFIASDDFLYEALIKGFNVFWNFAADYTKHIFQNCAVHLYIRHRYLSALIMTPVCSIHQDGSCWAGLYSQILPFLS